LNAIPVPGTLRDSLVLLAVVLEQQTELKPMQIMTDTGAYSDVVFGLFRLLDRRERFGRNPHGSSCSHAEGLFPPVCESARNRCCLLRGLLMRYQNRCAEPERYCVSSFKREPNRT
jgi:hypothetical protein